MVKHSLAAIAALTAAGGMAAEGADPLDAHRWRSRVLVVAAPDEADGRLRAQRQALASAAGGSSERALVTIEAIGRDARATALRRRLQLPEDEFRAVLIGMDGGAKLTSREPIPPQTLFATIDAMPMRRQETGR